MGAVRVRSAWPMLVTKKHEIIEARSDDPPSESQRSPFIHSAMERVIRSTASPASGRSEG